MPATEGFFTKPKTWKGFATRRSATIAVSTEDAGITISSLRGQDGGGVVRRIWLYVDGGDANSADKVTVNIYRDGEVTAGTSMPWDEYFGVIDIAAGIRTGVWVTTFVQDAAGFKYSADKSVLEYFTKSWKITITNNSGTNTCVAKYVIEGTNF